MMLGKALVFMYLKLRLDSLLIIKCSQCLDSINLGAIFGILLLFDSFSYIFFFIERIIPGFYL